MCFSRAVNWKVTVTHISTEILMRQYLYLWHSPDGIWSISNTFSIRSFYWMAGTVLISSETVPHLNLCMTKCCTWCHSIHPWLLKHIYLFFLFCIGTVHDFMNIFTVLRNWNTQPFHFFSLELGHMWIYNTYAQFVIFVFPVFAICYDFWF